jgi:hypothetical protein
MNAEAILLGLFIGYIVLEGLTSGSLRNGWVRDKDPKTRDSSSIVDSLMEED